MEHPKETEAGTSQGRSSSASVCTARVPFREMAAHGRPRS